MSLPPLLLQILFFFYTADPRQRNPEPAGGTEAPEQQRLRVVVGPGRRLRLQGHPLRSDLLHVRLPHLGHPHQRLRVRAGLRCHVVSKKVLISGQL